MKFLNNQRLADQAEKSIDTSTLIKMKEPPYIVQMLILVVCAFGGLMCAMYTKKYLFGIYTRDRFNFVDFKGDVPKIVIVIIVLLVLRPFIKSIFFPGGPFGKNTVFGYHLKSISLFSQYDGYMSKIRKVLSLLAPYIIITIIPLTLLKLASINRWVISYNTMIFYLYGNALLSCLDLYNAIFVILSPKNSMFYDDGKAIYVTDKDNIE